MKLLQMSDLLGSCSGMLYQMLLPGLVVDCSGSAAAIAFAIFLSGVSRIGLMMAGGALSDLISPKVLVLGAYTLRAGLFLALGSLVLTYRINLVELYGVCLMLGVTEAIALPARAALQARIIPPAQLQQANALISAQEKLISLAGPGLAGIGIAWLARAAAPGSHLPTAGAFAILVLAMTGAIGVLSQVRARRASPLALPRSGGEKEENGEILRRCTAKSPQTSQAHGGSLRNLARLLGRQKRLLGWVIVVIGVNAAGVGPLCIGLPILAVTRFAGEPQALALLMSVSGAGALLGTLLPGWLPVARRLLPLGIGLQLSGLGLLLFTPSLAAAMAAVLFIAAWMGYINVMGITHIQLETPPAYLGRMMGLLNLK